MSESTYLNDIMKKRKQEVMFPQDQQITNFGKDQAATDAVSVSPSSGSSNLASNLGASANLVNTLGAGSSSGGETSAPMSALSGAAAGASLGGPVGAVAGAAIGTIGALAANKSKRKALARQIESSKYQAISQIQQQHGQQEVAGIQNMIAGLRSAFLR